MRRLILILVILLSFSFVYADDLENEYIDLVQNMNFDKKELEDFEARYDNEALSLFLNAHVALLEYDYKTAYANLEEALEIVESDPLKIEIIYYLAMIDTEFDDNSSAIIRGVELKELSHETNNLIGVVRADRILAYGYYGNYDIDQATFYGEEASNLSMSIGYHLGVWENFGLEGTLLVNAGKIEEAVDLFNKAVRYSKEHDIKSIFYNVEALNVQRIAFVQNERSRSDVSKKILLEFLEESTEINPYLKAQIYYKIGLYDPLETGSIQYFDLALQYYDEVLKADHPAFLQNDIHQGLAVNHFWLGNYYEAANYYHLVNRFNSSGVNSGYGDQVEELERFKYDAVTDKVVLLEELAASKSKQLETQNRLIFIGLTSAAVVLFIVIILGIVLRSRRKSRVALHMSSITDDLTDVYNRSKIIELYESKLEGDNAIIMLDLDNFKSVNETFGHYVGDEVLKVVADTLKQSVRGGDVIGRFGGGEFLVVLEHASQDECRIVAERMRANIEACEWQYVGLNTTCSFGVTRIFSKNSEEVLKHVEALMYQAKSNGKNQVVYG